jgi:EpsI family protein
MMGTVHRWWGSLLAGVVLLAGGWGYRLTAAALSPDLAAQIRLDPPLSSLPLTLGPWQGQDVPVSAGVQRIAQNDDFVSRSYRSVETGDVVSLYVGYTARPRTMLRHRPTVCYPSAGWSHLQTRTVEVLLPASARPSPGRPVSLPALVHAFMRPAAASEARVLVLNYYVLNGQVTIDENSFWGLRWRDPNPGRNASRYVAQVQLMVPQLGSVETAERIARKFAAASAPGILKLLPGAPRLEP